MTITMKYPLLALLPLVLFACGSDPVSEADAKKVEGQRRIRAMEDSIFVNQAFDMRSAQAMIDVYKAYTTAYPQDSLAPEYLFRAGGTYESMHNVDEALVMYDRVVKDYPQWNRMVDVLYKKAVMLHNAGRLGEARGAYEEVIGKFPDHKFAQDARVLIEDLGMSTEEWLKRAKEKEKDADAGSGT